ncbi:adenine phosphoribosyltransferase [soil metagenome]
MRHTSLDDAALRDRISATLRDVPDFPKPGIMFKDVTPVLGNPALLRDVIAAMSAPWLAHDITHVAGIESRGFIFGAPIALALGAGFIPIRKPGKLPWRTVVQEYALEYRTDRLEIHVDACSARSRVLLVDDVLATGGTAGAACDLIGRLEGEVVGCSFLLAISALRGIARLAGRRVETLIEV